MSSSPWLTPPGLPMTGWLDPSLSLAVNEINKLLVYVFLVFSLLKELFVSFRNCLHEVTEEGEDYLPLFFLKSNQTKCVDP